MSFPSAAQTLPTSDVTTSRVASVDILRGFVMIIMALDHVRDFWSRTVFRAEDVTQTSGMLFFTRWITHFCAPTFLFLAGVSVFLYSQKHTRKEVSIFLFTRGLWLMIAEIVLFSFLIQYSYNMILLTVIWAIGWSMILMSALTWLPRWLLAVLSVVIIAGHNLLPNIETVTSANLLPAILHNSPFFIQLEALPGLLVAYSIFPWAAVMMAGFVIGYWFTYPIERLNSLLTKTGITLLLIFIAVRAINIYGDPALWSTQPRGWFYTVLSFINISKYPPSLLFLCLTLGIASLLLVLFNKLKNPVTNFFRVYGQVPFFYFAVHLFVISSTAMIWSYLSFGTFVNFAFVSPKQWPAEYSPSLVRAYSVWILVIAVLYFPCRWFGNYRKTHKGWWLSYL